MNARRTLVPSLRSAMLLALALAGPWPLPGPGAPAAARADVPAGTPVFTAPTLVDHPYHPLQPGSFRVYAGREGGVAITVVEFHLEETRTFAWQGLDIPCVAVEENTFVDGAVVEESTTWFAQADDGSVWAFGEVTVKTGDDDDDDGDDDDEDDEDDEDEVSWVVGAVAPSDPPGTLSTADPFLRLPGSPVTGDAWVSEDLGGTAFQSNRVVRGDASLRTAAGRFPGCLVVEERGVAGSGREWKSYAPGVGLVHSRGRGERLALRAGTTLVRGGRAR